MAVQYAPYLVIFSQFLPHCSSQSDVCGSQHNFFDYDWIPFIFGNSSQIAHAQRHAKFHCNILKNMAANCRGICTSLGDFFLTQSCVQRFIQREMDDRCEHEHSFRVYDWIQFIFCRDSQIAHAKRYVKFHCNMLKNMESNGRTICTILSHFFAVFTTLLIIERRVRQPA